MKPKFNGVYLTNNLTKKRDWTYVVNLHEIKINRKTLDSIICE